MQRTRLLKSCVLLLIVAGCAEHSPPAENSGTPGPAATAAAAITSLADSYYEWVLETQPEAAYFAAIDVENHDGLADNSPAARARSVAFEDDLLRQLRAIDASLLRGRPEWVTAVLLTQRIQSDIELRICARHGWNVNQMGGWHLAYSQLAELQPVDNPLQRDEALRRWSSFAGFADQELANLKAGLAAGYSAPQAVVRRVVEQLDGLLNLPPEDSPFFSPGARAGDAAFRRSMRALLVDEINPALARYRDYLASTYLDAAREELSITANPDGDACYEASLRSYTTLDRPAREVFELGELTVAENIATVRALGNAAYGVDDFVAAIRAAKSDAADGFENSDELLAFSREAVRRAADEMPRWVGTMPAQAVDVVPFAEHEEGTGRSAHYRPGNEERAAEYRIPLHKPGEQSRGNAEATAFHETWPGHHLQVATAQSVGDRHPVTRLIWFSGPGEGWARYAEALAEEMGLYQSATGPILRRAWPARGMVVDPGIHLYGWTREQAIEYMIESGRFPRSSGDSMVDRIAILPGQLTAYDSGGLEILALRQQAEAALGAAFDIREFHDRVLENGTIPLGALRTHIETWIAAQQGED